MEAPYQPSTLTQAQVLATRGPLVLLFGTNWCGYCIDAEDDIARALGRRADVPIIKVEDGRGLVFGRAYKIKLWPTLVCLHNGQELSRVVRPKSEAEVSNALHHLPRSSCVR